MARILLKPVKIYGDIKNGTLEADSRGLVFIGYSIESGKFFVLNENIETGYDTYTLEEVAGKLGLTIEFLQGVVARGEIIETDELFPVAGEVESIEETEPAVDAEPEPVTLEDLENAGEAYFNAVYGESNEVEEEVQEIEVDFEKLYMDAMEENKALTEENTELFKETVELTQENTNLKAELDLLKTDDGKLAELVKSKGYILIVK